MDSCLPTTIVFAATDIMQINFEKILLLITVLICSYCNLSIASEEKILGEIHVKGNRHINVDNIYSKIHSKRGELLNQDFLREDIKTIYKSGYFEDVWVELIDRPEGVDVTINVREKNIVRRIRIKGNRIFSQQQIMTILGVEKKVILVVDKIEHNLENLVIAYKEKNYVGVDIDLKKTNIDDSLVDLTIFISEGEQSFIKEISVTGNSAIRGSFLKELMKTSERRAFPIFRAGDLNEKLLSKDIETLSEYYRSQGYCHVKISDAKITILRNGYSIEIIIDEGCRCIIGEVSVSVFGGERNSELENFARKEIANDYLTRDKIFMINKFYADRGYPFANVVPKISRSENACNYNVDFQIDKGEKYIWGEILVEGNQKIPENFILTNLKFKAGDEFSGEVLKLVKYNIMKLGFFDGVEIIPIHKTEAGVFDCVIRVKEKRSLIPFNFILFSAVVLTLCSFVMITGWVQDRRRIALFGLLIFLLFSIFIYQAIETQALGEKEKEDTKSIF